MRVCNLLPGAAEMDEEAFDDLAGVKVVRIVILTINRNMGHARTRPSPFGNEVLLCGMH